MRKWTFIGLAMLLAAIGTVGFAQGAQARVTWDSDDLPTVATAATLTGHFPAVADEVEVSVPHQAKSTDNGGTNTHK